MEHNKKSTTLSQQVPSILGKFGYCSAKEILQYSKTSGRKVSIQAVHQVLRRLEKSGMVVRYGSVWSLSLVWLLELSEFAASATNNYLSKAAKYLLPAHGAKNVWKLGDLKHLDNLWMQILTEASLSPKVCEIRSWTPYPWFDIVQPYVVAKFRGQLALRNVKIFHAIPDTSPLTQEIAKRWNKRLYSYCLGVPDSSFRRSEYLQVLDDLLLTISFDSHMNGLIKHLFLTSRSLVDIDVIALHRLLTTKFRVTVTLERGTRRSRKVARELLSYFS